MTHFRQPPQENTWINTFAQINKMQKAKREKATEINPLRNE